MKSKVISHTGLDVANNLNLFSLGYNDKDGGFRRWNVVSRRKIPKAISKDFSPDCVVIVAYHYDSDRVVLLKQYRATIDGIIIEFPAGKIDEGESIEEAATRELKEETGLDLFRVDDISPPIYSSSGMTDESVVLVFCSCLGEISTDKNETTEEIEPFFLSRDDLESLLDGTYFEEPVSFCIRTWLVLGYNSYE